MPRSVLVTGAFGKIGCGTLRHLLAAGHRVTAVDLKTPATVAAAAQFGDTVAVVWGNICDAGLWHRTLSGVDAVIHLAAILPPAAYRNLDLTEAVNITATADLIRHMEATATAKRLIFASSMVVAGFEQHRRLPPLTTDEAPRPDDPYGKSKTDAERHIQNSTLHWSILRVTACIGSELSLRERDNIGLMFDASPTGRVEVVHHDDAALAFANAVDCDAAIGKILFVGGGVACRTRALAFYNGVLDAIGLGPIKATALRPGPAYCYGDWVDTTESQRLLSFQRHSLDSILAEFRARAGFKRWLLKLFSPLLTWLIERRSPHRTHN